MAVKTPQVGSEFKDWFSQSEQEPARPVGLARGMSPVVVGVLVLALVVGIAVAFR